jgi:hypothetical protein
VGQAHGKALRLSATSGVVALVGAGVVTVTPVTPPPEIAPPQHHTAVSNAEVRLAAASIANIPPNLIYAVANVPYNEVQALNEVARSLFFTGNWFVGSSTNIWGEDPGDPTHFQSIIDVLFPYPALSGPAAFQLAMLAAAEIPVNAACAAQTCTPLVPLQPITGITAIDKTIWTAAILLGYPFPLLNNWFRVPFSELMSGYTFGNVVNPAGPVNSQFGFQGTVPGPNGEPLMPWSGTTFTLNPLAPWENFFNSLMATPPSLANGIHIPSAQDLSQVLAADLAGLVVDFNPFVPGSPFCPGACALPYFLTTEGIVRTILAFSPGNPLIEEWLARTANGTANGPTQAQTDFATQVLQGDLGVFKFNPDTTAVINAVLNSINPVLPTIAVHSGLLGAFDFNALLADVGRLLGFGVVSSATPPVAPGSPLVAPAGPAHPPNTGAPMVTLALTPPGPPADQVANPSAGSPGTDTRLQAADFAPAATPPAGGGVLTVMQAITPDTTASTTTNDQRSGTAATNTSTNTSTATANDQRSGTAATNTSTTAPTDTTRDGNKVEPVRSGGRHAKPDDALAGALPSVRDQISSTISNPTDGLKGGRTETGKAETGAASSGHTGK